MIQKELELGIADIVISVVSEDKKQKFRIDGPYKYFITDGKPDISLHTHYGYIPNSKSEKKIFDTGTTWSMFQNNGKYILKTSSKAVILEPDFKSGDIYIRAQGTKRKVEYPLNYPLGEVLMINLLSRGRGLLVHACGLSYQGKGILFAGSGGAGKSTMANLYKGRRKTALLSDDRIIIRKMDNEFFIYGTPWHGDAKICSPERAPLERIFFLRHAPENKVKKIDLIDATSRLIVCSFPTFWDKKGMAFTLKFCAELAEKVPCYILDFLPDKSVIDFVRDR